MCVRFWGCFMASGQSSRDGEGVSEDKESSSDAEIMRQEVEQHVLYATLRPAVRLARRFRMPLKEFGQWSEVGYFHEMRRRGMKMREISAALGVSMRKAALLSKQLKESFFEPEQHGLARRIEFMVWAEPLSLARMQQAMPDEPPEEIEQALERLVEEERVIARQGRVVTYTVARGASRLVRASWVAKIDALNQLLDTVTGAVHARFFDADPNAMARNLQLRVREEDLGELQRLYEELIWERLSALDEAAQGCEDAVSIDLAICWTPHEHIEALSEPDES